MGEVIEVVVGPLSLLFRVAVVIGVLWFLPSGLRLIRAEVAAARRVALVDPFLSPEVRAARGRSAHPAGTGRDAPYDHEAEALLHPEDDMLWLYDQLILEGYHPDDYETFEEVARELDLPVERVQALLGTPWLD